MNQDWLTSSSTKVQHFLVEAERLIKETWPLYKSPSEKDIFAVAAMLCQVYCTRWKIELMMDVRDK